MEYVPVANLKLPHRGILSMDYTRAGHTRGYHISEANYIRAHVVRDSSLFHVFKVTYLPWLSIE
jgi:hypothetical protein